MQNKKIKEEMQSFMMPSKAVEASGIKDGDLLEITACCGRIVIERIKKADCDGDCVNCAIADEDCDGDCLHCPCGENCN